MPSRPQPTSAHTAGPVRDPDHPKPLEGADHPATTQLPPRRTVRYLPTMQDRSSALNEAIGPTAPAYLRVGRTLHDGGRVRFGPLQGGLLSPRH